MSEVFRPGLRITNDKSACVQVSKTELDWLVDMSHGRSRGVILLAGLNRSILGGVSGTSRERGAVGFTDIGGLLLNQELTNWRIGDTDGLATVRPELVNKCFAMLAIVRTRLLPASQRSLTAAAPQ
jgi:hypothetical protein